LNQAIQTLLVRLNQRPFKKLPGSREQLFKTLDYPALNPLPATPYVYAEWKKVRVHIDYHIEAAGHYYSVPYTLIKQVLDARLTQHTIELFHRGKRVASHVRSRRKGGFTTVNQHMPEAHQKYSEWSPQRFRQWAEKIGVATTQVITTILTSRRHPQQGYRACLGILRLAKAYGAERLEAASERALTLGTCRYKSIESILKNHLDSQPLQQTTAQHLPQHHDNIRGPGYYH
jgi:transposase